MASEVGQNGKQNEQPTADRPISELGKALRKIREEALAAGEIETMTVDEINDMIAEIRGGVVSRPRGD
jgi:hypothetical protein